VTLKPSMRTRRPAFPGIQRAMRTALHSLGHVAGRIVPEMGAFATQSKVVMRDRAGRPLNVHLDSTVAPTTERATRHVLAPSRTLSPSPLVRPPLSLSLSLSLARSLSPHVSALFTV
jgi:hypothetical protein